MGKDVSNKDILIEYIYVPLFRTYLIEEKGMSEMEVTHRLAVTPQKWDGSTNALVADFIDDNPELFHSLL